MVWSLFKLFAIFKMLFPLRQKTSPTLVFQPTATVNSLEHPHTCSTSTGLITESFSQQFSDKHRWKKIMKIWKSRSIQSPENFQVVLQKLSQAQPWDKHCNRDVMLYLPPCQQLMGLSSLWSLSTNPSDIAANSWHPWIRLVISFL